MDETYGESVKRPARPHTRPFSSFPAKMVRMHTRFCGPSAAHPCGKERRLIDELGSDGIGKRGICSYGEMLGLMTDGAKDEK